MKTPLREKALAVLQQLERNRATAGYADFALAIGYSLLACAEGLLYEEVASEDQSALEKYAEEHKKAALRAVEKLFDENTDELTDLGQKVMPDAWMGDGVMPK